MPELTYLDFGPSRLVTSLAPAAEAAGFRRYWVGEHHSPTRTSNPLLVSGVVAAVTEKLRVGTGGVCLPFHRPFQVFEDARILAGLFPGRVDLGVCNGLGLPPHVLAGLLDGKRPAPDAFYTRAEELLALLHAAESEDPGGHAPPAFWVLGMGDTAALFAAEHGVGFAFSEYHNPGSVDGRAVIARYRDAFVPRRAGDRPSVIVAQGATCGRTGRDASRLHALVVPRLELAARLPCGTAREIAERLEGLRVSLDAHEVAFIDLCWTLPAEVDARLAAIEGLGAAFGGAGRSGRATISVGEGLEG
jgi:luciferase family oxidoreductase group 1